MLLSRRTAVASTLAAIAACTSLGIQAETFPEKPLKILVGAPPGGTVDIMARALSDGLSKDLGQPVIVENKPGGGGMIAVQELTRANHDGYTMLLGISGIVTEIPHAFKLPIEPIKVLTPLVELARTGLLLVGNVNVPANNLKEVVTHLKANPGKINYASYSSGSLSHTMGVVFNQLAGTDMVHIGYRGSTPGLVDVMGGHVSYMFDAPASVLPLYKTGKLKVFATSSPERNPALPEVPTFTELGYKDINETPWVSVYVPPDVPAAAQTRLRDALLKQLRLPQIKERWAGIGMSMPPSPPASQQALIKTLQQEHAKHGKKLAEIGFKPE